VAYLIIAIVLIGAFMVPFVLSLIDTQPDHGSGSQSWKSGPEIWGTQIGSLAMRFQLNQSVEITETTTAHRFSDVPGVVGTEYLIDGRITADTTDVTAPAIIHFDQLSFTGDRDKQFKYNSNAQESKTLNAGWYRYVTTFSLESGTGTLAMLAWNFGLSDQSEAGSVYKAVYYDHNRDGHWEENVVEGVHSFYLILDGPSETTPTNETEQQQLITTGKTRTQAEHQELMYTIFIVGIMFLILGFIFIALGSKTHFIFTILGIIFILVGLMMLAWASYVLLAGFWKKEKVPKRVKVDFYTRRKHR
jgi:hypothetical protein